MKIKEKTGFRLLYLATVLTVFFGVFVFSENNSFSKHKELNKTIRRLETNIAKSKSLINNRYSYQELLRDSLLFEHYVREQLNMKKANEVVFVIVE